MGILPRKQPLDENGDRLWRKQSFPRQASKPVLHATESRRAELWQLHLGARVVNMAECNQVADARCLQSWTAINTPTHPFPRSLPPWFVGSLRYRR
jgi:hypothetical protein